ncbi:MAG: ABC transporter ATP-binding protein [Christensenellales bacterium]|jgi:putative ABC transport system ATP-binding protein
MEPILHTDNVSRIYQSGDMKVVALQDISMNVMPGSLTMLRGRSGSGKTTLINLLGTLDRPTSGHIYYEDQDISALPDNRRDALRRKNMGFIFQSVALIGQMSAYENVEFGLRLANYPMKLRRDRAMECLEFVGLKNRVTHRPSELSGGEQQRVAIARAIAHKPKIVFADEPTAEVDSTMGLRIMRLLRNMVEQEGITVLMTTHDPHMIDLGDHIYSLSDGQIVEELFMEVPRQEEAST